MAKNIDNLTVIISVENAEEALVKAMGISKDKLENWFDGLLKGGYYTLAEEVGEYIDIIVKAQEERK